MFVEQQYVTERRRRQETFHVLLREEDEEEAAPAVVPLGASATGAATHTTPIAAAPLEEPRSALTRASRAAAAGWTGAAAGGALAGVTAGTLGGLLLATAPGTAASFAVIPALAFIGACCGGLGGAGVGAGLSAAVAVATSQRTAALAIGGAIGGGLIGTAVQWLARWSLAALVGVHLDIGGSLEGVIIGAAAAPWVCDRNIRRRRTSPGNHRTSVRPIAAWTAVTCGVAAPILTGAGWPWLGSPIHAIATGSDGSQAALTPLVQLMQGKPILGRCRVRSSAPAKGSYSVSVSRLAWLDARKRPVLTWISRDAHRSLKDSRAANGDAAVVECDVHEVTRIGGVLACPADAETRGKIDSVAINARHRAAVRARLVRSDHVRAGADSVTWKINREMIVIAGWGRAILLQLAHPAVAAGVHGHSSFRGSLGASFRRLHSTVGAMLSLTFGDTERMVTAAAGINAIHDRVRGRVPYLDGRDLLGSRS